ncbi:MAG: cytochrome c oxidase subunit 3 [Planctomycetes bacterium]|nr:cytochrome c oxidase subunit 3 [Planctomycetota bacterium]
MDATPAAALPAAPPTALSAALPSSPWAGGVSPFAVSWQKLMLWYFIVTDALLFAGFLAAYGFNRLAGEAWPDRAHVFHMSFITAMTFILISSSATMATAVAAARRKDPGVATRFLLLTLLGGFAFLGMQAFEWSSLIRAGARLTSNPWGPPGFGAFFFVITGFHGTHVVIGTVVLLIAAARAALGRLTPEGIELAGLYWHFVDLVWVFVFGCFYLI